MKCNSYCRNHGWQYNFLIQWCILCTCFYCVYLYLFIYVQFEGSLQVKYVFIILSKNGSNLCDYKDLQSFLHKFEW